jgi:CheY-like chemotaxis protein
MARAGPEVGVRVALADDHPGLRMLMRELLALLPQVEVVGEAVDGVEAVRLAEAEQPDVFLLDVEMPRMDGIAAAELIRSFRPQTRIVLHTASLEEEPRQRARDAGLPLLDKTDSANVLAELLAQAEEPAPEGEHREIEALVLTALQKTRGDGVVVVRADGDVPYYNARAANELRLPYPAKPIRLEQLRSAYDTRTPDGDPLPPDDRPIATALRERRSVEMQIALCRHGELVVLETTAVPFFDEHGNLLGAAHYFHRAA